MEAAAGPAGERAAQPDARRLLEARQRQLRARIAACEQLRAELAALRAALRSGPAGDGSARGAPGGRAAPSGRSREDPRSPLRPGLGRSPAGGAGEPAA